MDGKDVQKFSDRSETYDSGFLGRAYHRPLRDKLTKVIAPLLEKERRVLDVGCGTGQLLHSLVALQPGAQYFGIDPSDLLNIATRNYSDSSLTFQRAFVEQLPYKEQTFDLVISSDSFHHWHNQRVGLQEIARVLKSGGVFILEDPFAIGWFRLWRVFNKRHRTMREMRAMLGSVGLELKASHPLLSYFKVPLILYLHVEKR